MWSHRSAWKRVPSLCLAIALALFTSLASGEPPAVMAAPVGLPGAAPRIALLTMGPGDDFVTKFGHDALVVEYPGQRARVYNFGMYTRQSITVSRVLSGRLRYWLAVAPYADTVALYRLQNRSLLTQDLALEPSAARALAAALAENARPENASYLYDYALDNCTTRVRDALDRATGGALRRTLEQAPAALTYRDHALRLIAGDPLLSALFDLGLGARADRPLSGWDDAFLPDRLAAAVRRVKLGTDGVERPLVARERVLFTAARAPVLEWPPSRWGWWLAAGVAVAGALVMAARSPWRGARRAGGVIAGLASFAVGALGVLLTALLLTQVHAVVRPNVNVLLCSPLALLLVTPSLRVAWGRPLHTRRAERVALACLVMSALGLLAAVLMGQKSAHFAGFFFPFWLAQWWLMRAGARDALQT